MKKLLLAAGGQPGALLLAPLYKALKKKGAYQPIVMLATPVCAEPISRDLAASFGIGEASHSITLPKGTPVEQLAVAMTAMEKIMLSEKPDLVLVCGCDNAAFGAAVTAAKLGLPVAAVDAGLRSYERSDADEVNRVVIDAMADLHFVSEHSGEYNLINEGVADEKVFFAGNLLIDSLVGLMEEANNSDAAVVPEVKPKKYALVLLNPAGRFSEKEPLEMIHRLLKEISGKSHRAVVNKANSQVWLYDDAIAWHEQQQISGDIILLHFTESGDSKKKQRLDEMQVHGNAFFAAADTLSRSPVVYDQFGGKKMVIRLLDGSKIEDITVTSQAEILYHLYNEKQQPSGINYSSGDMIRMLFTDGRLNRIKVTGNVEGKQYPENFRGNKSIDLPKFIWREEENPFRKQKSLP